MPSVAIVGGGFGGVGAAALLRRAGHDGRDAVRARRAPRRRLASQHLSGRGVRHPVAPVRVSRSRPTRAGRAATRRRPRSRPTSRTSRGARRASPHVDRGAARRAGTARAGCWTTSAGTARRRRPDHGVRAALAAERPAAARARVVRRARVPHRAMAPRRAARGQAGGGDRHGLQRRPGRARDRGRGRGARRLPALARLDDPEARLRLPARARGRCSSASRRCSGSTARRSSTSTSSSPTA